MTTKQDIKVSEDVQAMEMRFALDSLSHLMNQLSELEREVLLAGAENVQITFQDGDRLDERLDRITERIMTWSGMVESERKE